MPVSAPLPKIKDQQADAPEAKNNRLINNVTFFGDSAIPENDPIYQSVWQTAKLLAENNYTVVDGGGPGIMKAATDGAESVNGQTTAVYWQPKLASFFEGKNLANITDESETASNYIMRTFGLIEKGDVYVVCKGGTGTISEFGLVWCLAKLYYGCHKPVILFGDFWDEVIQAIQKGMYIDDTEMGVLYNAKTPQDVLNLIQAHEQKIQHCRDKHYNGDEAAFLISGKKEKTKLSYNKIALDYHEQYAGKLVAEEQLKEFCSLVNPPAQVLDIGTGPGFDAKYLAEKYSVTGIEISEKSAEIAQYENPNITIVNADIVEYDIGVNKYKGIWARGSLHHIGENEQDLVFKKLADGLVEGGILYVIVREGQGELIETEKRYYHTIERFFHLYSEDELRERANKVGLEVMRIGHQKRSHDWLIGVFKKI